MAAQQNGLAKSLPLSILLLVVGGALGYLAFDNDPMKAAVMAVFFGVCGAFLGMQIQILAALSGNQTDGLSEEISSAIGDGMGNLSSQLESTANKLGDVSRNLESGFGTSAQALQAGLTASSDSLTAALKTHEAAMQKTTVDLSKNIVDSYAAGAETFKQALATHIEEINSASVEWHDEYRKVLTGYSEKIHSTSEVLADKLSEIAKLAASIDEVLHVNEALGGALKTISSAEEFKDTMVKFKDHLAASDQLLKEVSKPRIIQLVESDADA